MAYSLLLGFIMISFLKATNIPESILSFAKYFTVFNAAYIISIILRLDRQYIKTLVITFVFLLLWDCFTVFYSIFLYVSGQINNIIEIKSVYANKNILAAAIFVKIPFGLWLISFERGWLKKIGFFALVCALLATLYMSTRTFYLASAFLAVAYIAFVMIFNARYKVSPRYKMPVFIFAAFFSALIIFTITQKYFYPKEANTYNAAISERLSTIRSDEMSSLLRLESWKRSVNIFKHDPFLGIGIGNWKILNMKYENQTKSDFVFMYNTHNDFIEITTETGIFGGLIFISIFAFLIYNFIVAFFNKNATINSFSYLFLAAFGIFCYSFDAFFNFPSDRPEIQTLFAIYIGAGIAYSPGFFQDINAGNPLLKKLLSSTYILILVFCSYILLLNFLSLRLQRYADDELQSGKQIHSADFFINNFPSIPNLTISGPEPIAAIKAQFLIKESRYQDAINIMRPDKSCPYSVSREHYMAMAYSKLGNYDSALLYAYKALVMKPRYFIIPDFICKVLIQQGKKEEAIKLLNGYICLVKTNSQAWLDLSALYWETGKYQNSLQSIDSAIQHLPKDTILLKTKIKLQRDVRIINNQQTYSNAMENLARKNYPEALKYLNAFISKETSVAIVFAGRAYCYYYGKEYNRCINDINRSIDLGNNTSDLINLRGLCNRLLGNADDACADFQTASARGDKDAIKNLERFCKGH
ncbi:MAG: O-antigen ligase family protein [bacterium]